MHNKYTFTLDGECKKYAEQYIGECEETRHLFIQEIRNWLCENSHLNARQDDLAILVFLRTCKFNIEKTKEKMKNYYETKTLVPEWFSNRNPELPEMKDLFELGVFVPLTSGTADGKLVVIIRTAAHDPAKHKQNDVFKAGKMILDIAVNEYEKASIYGVVAIFDMKNVTWRHGKQMTPSIIKKAVNSWQNYHCRPQSLEFINAPSYINVVLDVFKLFMNEKLKKRTHIHYSGYENLYKTVPKEILPEEYGGTGGKLKDVISYWQQKVIEYKDWYKDDEKYKATL